MPFYNRTRNSRDFLPRWSAPRLPPGKASSVIPRQSPLQCTRWRRSAAGQRLCRSWQNLAQNAVFVFFSIGKKSASYICFFSLAVLYLKSAVEHLILRVKVFFAPFYREFLYCKKLQQVVGNYVDFFGKKFSVLKNSGKKSPKYSPNRDFVSFIFESPRKNNWCCSTIEQSALFYISIFQSFIYN